MEKKKALIVDDSKLARFVLKEMLHEYGLEADTTESAEEALGYLCTQRPDVIFMDHTMPGMDGFKAVEAIKQDPQTTAIPIMMYTSKEGEMYVSQARALGAIGVLPKQLKSVQLGKVLEQLNLVPAGEDTQSDGFVGPPDVQKTLQLAGEENHYADNTEVSIDSQGRTGSSSLEDLEKVAADVEDAVPERYQSGEDAAIELPDLKLPERVSPSRQSFSAEAAGNKQQYLDLSVLENIAHDVESSVEVNMFKPLLQELLDEQRKLIREDIRKGAVAITRRLTGEAQTADTEESERETYVPPPPPQEPPKSNHFGTLFTFAVFLVPFIWLFFEHSKTVEELTALKMDNEQLEVIDLEVADSLFGAENNDQQFMAMEAKHEREHGVLLEAIEWAVNSRNTIPFGEPPLGDTALEILSTLVPKLIDTEFTGTIVLKSHNAKFCVVENDGGEQSIPAASRRLKECKLVEQDMTESIEFTNYLTTLRESGYKAIQVRIENRADLEPIEPYPPQDGLTTAGDWNRVAEKNNRIEIALEPGQKGVALN